MKDADNIPRMKRDEMNRVVDSFADTLALGDKFILDERDLAYPKSLIYLAFGFKVSECRMRIMGVREDRKESVRQELELVRSLTARISNFQVIDTEDQEEVRKINADPAFPQKIKEMDQKSPQVKSVLVLFLKYIARAKEEDERLLKMFPQYPEGFPYPEW